VWRLILEGNTHQIPSALTTGGEYGMPTLDSRLGDLVGGGRITREAALNRYSKQDTLVCPLERG
jgi:Tfp pilus assembly pilus retraction ATPase PilT